MEKSPLSSSVGKIPAKLENCASKQFALQGYLIETQRLLLRELDLKDAPTIFALNNDREVIKFTGDLPFKDEREAWKFLFQYDHYQKYGYGRWAVLLKEDLQFIGWCGLKFHPEDGSTDLGFRFFQKYWNKGYASEAADACLRYGFEELKLDKIIGRARLANHASIRVLQKTGMRQEREFSFDGQPGVIYFMENATIQKP